MPYALPFSFQMRRLDNAFVAFSPAAGWNTASWSYGRGFLSLFEGFPSSADPSTFALFFGLPAASSGLKTSQILSVIYPVQNASTQGIIDVGIPCRNVHLSPYHLPIHFIRSLAWLQSIRIESGLGLNEACCTAGPVSKGGKGIGAERATTRNDKGMERGADDCVVPGVLSH
jgi:hypothetical protein